MRKLILLVLPTILFSSGCTVATVRTVLQMEPKGTSIETAELEEETLVASNPAASARSFRPTSNQPALLTIEEDYGPNGVAAPVVEAEMAQLPIELVPYAERLLGFNDRFIGSLEYGNDLMVMEVSVAISNNFNRIESAHPLAEKYDELLCLLKHHAHQAIDMIRADADARLTSRSVHIGNAKELSDRIDRLLSEVTGLST